MSLFEFLQSCVVGSEIIAFCIAIYTFVKIPQDKKLRIVFAILLLTVLVELTSIVLRHLYTKGQIEVTTSFGLFNVYNLIVYVLWYYLFSKLLNGKSKKIALASIVIYLIAACCEAIFLLDYRIYLQEIAHIVGSLLLAITVLLYFIQILRHGYKGKMINNPFFWISCGLLFYYVANIPYRVVSNYYAYAVNSSYLVFYMKLIFSTMMYIMISIGLYKYKSLE